MTRHDEFPPQPKTQAARDRRFVTQNRLFLSYAKEGIRSLNTSRDSGKLLETQESGFISHLSMGFPRLSWKLRNS